MSSSLSSTIREVRLESGSAALRRGMMLYSAFRFQFGGSCAALPRLSRRKMAMCSCKAGGVGTTAKPRSVKAGMKVGCGRPSGLKTASAVALSVGTAPAGGIGAAGALLLPADSEDDTSAPHGPAQEPSRLSFQSSQGDSPSSSSQGLHSPLFVQ